MTETKGEGHKELEPEEVVDYIARLGDDIARYARTAQDLMAIARERGIPFDLGETLKPFQPTERHELDLTNLRLATMGISTSLLHQGVVVSPEELAAYRSRSPETTTPPVQAPNPSGSPAKVPGVVLFDK
ncbi:MAG: hypothetical protein WC489_03890 [Patescibacteria group bacterium]